eukprot:9707947-Alexandrium_andersonii.AAC.1
MDAKLGLLKAASQRAPKQGKDPFAWRLRSAPGCGRERARVSLRLWRSSLPRGVSARAMLPGCPSAALRAHLTL